MSHPSVPGYPYDNPPRAYATPPSSQNPSTSPNGAFAQAPAPASGFQSQPIAPPSTYPPQTNGYLSTYPSQYPLPSQLPAYTNPAYPTYTPPGSLPRGGFGGLPPPPTQASLSSSLPPSSYTHTPSTYPPPQTSSTYGPPPASSTHAPPYAQPPYSAPPYGQQHTSQPPYASHTSQSEYPPSQPPYTHTHTNPYHPTPSNAYPPPSNDPQSVYPNPPHTSQPAYPPATQTAQATYPPPSQSRADVSTTQPTASPSRRSGNARIDPSQIPRPPHSTASIVYETRSSQTQSRPPPSCTSCFMAVDSGNCSPRYMRAAMYVVPTTHTVRLETGIPFGVVCNPMADPCNGEEPVSMVDFGDSGPIRCTRCKGYINPYVTWQSNGNTWICNLCGKANDTPADYYSSLDGSQQRRDRLERPELSKGSVDLLVTADYCVRPLQEPVYVFAIDVSGPAIQMGFTNECLKIVRQCLDYLPGGSRARIGILTFSSRVHFYQVKASRPDDPIMVYNTEVDDPFSAFPADSWILSVSENRDTIELLLNSLPAVANSLCQSELAAPAAAIRAAADGMKVTGGRLFLMTSSFPAEGFGKLRARENFAFYGTEREWATWAPPPLACVKIVDKEDKVAIQTYDDLAGLCMEAQVCVDVLIYTHGGAFKDVSAFAHVCRQTGGDIHYFNGSMESMSSCMADQIFKAVTGVRANEAVIKLRCSGGIRCEGYLSAGSIRSTGEVDMASLHSHTSLTCLLTHDGSLKQGSECYLQLAVLYTTLTGARVVRVHNLSLGINSSHAAIFRGADLDACVCIYANKAVDLAQKEGTDKAHQWLVEQTVELLLKYREQCSASSPKGQLILPEPLKLVPLYVLGMLKHPSLMANSSSSGRLSNHDMVRADERSYNLNRLFSMPPNELMKALYPRLYSLGHEFADGEGEQDLVGGSVVYKLPRPLHSCSELLESEGAFVLDDGRYLYLYIGRAVPDSSLQEWFGIGPTEMPETVVFSDSSHHAQRMSNVISQLRSEWRHSPPLVCVWAEALTSPNIHPNTHPHSHVFCNRLTEDAIRGTNSYVDFLCALHAKISARLNK